MARKPRPLGVWTACLDDPLCLALCVRGFVITCWCETVARREGVKRVVNGQVIYGQACTRCGAFVRRRPYQTSLCKSCAAYERWKAVRKAAQVSMDDRK